MNLAAADELVIAVDVSTRVSGLLQVPKDADACYVVAHGAGLGMTHPFMAAVAQGLFDRGIATLRFQFPYMERGAKRPDSPKIAQATVRAAVAEAQRRMPEFTLVAGGKSYGARMTSEAQASSPMAGVKGLAFLGFPLHPPGEPSDERAEHLSRVLIPMLFLQGTRDEFASLALLKPVLERLGERATLKLIEDGEHSFRMPAGSPRKQTDVMKEVLDTLAKWIEALG